MKIYFWSSLCPAAALDDKDQIVSFNYSFLVKISALAQNQKPTKICMDLVLGEKEIWT